MIEDESEDEDNQTDESGQNDSENSTTDNTNKSTDKKDVKTTDNRWSNSKTMIPVKVLTQEDCDSGKYSLFDVVLPLPGYSVEYPPNMVDYYEELLTKDELKLDMKHKHR